MWHNPKMTNRQSQMIKLNELLVEAYRDFVAEDGGMMTKANDEQDPFPGFERKTSRVDNSTLFRAQLEILRSKIGVQWNLGPKADAIALHQYVRDLEISASSIQGGLYSRNPGRKDNASFDEYTGLCAISVFCFMPWIAQNIVKRGEATGYMFNAVTPDQPGLRNWRQGADLFVYKTCAGVTATPYELLWFILGVFWAFKHPKGETSDALLNWVKLETVCKKLSVLDATPTQKIYGVFCDITFAIWRVECAIRRGGVKGLMMTYFGWGHVLTRIAHELKI